MSNQNGTNGVAHRGASPSAERVVSLISAQASAGSAAEECLRLANEQRAVDAEIAEREVELDLLRQRRENIANRRALVKALLRASQVEALGICQDGADEADEQERLSSAVARSAPATAPKVRQIGRKGPSAPAS